MFPLFLALALPPLRAEEPASSPAATAPPATTAPEAPAASLPVPPRFHVDPDGAVRTARDHRVSVDALAEAAGDRDTFDAWAKEHARVRGRWLPAIFLPVAVSGYGLLGLLMCNGYGATCDMDLIRKQERIWGAGAGAFVVSFAGYRLDVGRRGDPRRWYDPDELTDVVARANRPPDPSEAADPAPE